jgi:vacuolar protein sorting-associated protein 13A/C
MFEGLASWLIESYIGKYINVSPDKLSIGLLSGIIELENVYLKPDAFNEYSLHSPFELKVGIIGKIKFNVSLANLRYSPWILAAENFCLIIGPKKFPSHTTYKNKLEDTLSDLEKKWFEKAELIALQTSSTGQQTGSIWFSFLGSIAYSILKNLNVNLKNLHVRYEDPDNNFGFGVTIESIQIKNENNIITNPDFAEKFNSSSSALFSIENVVSKICEITNFSVECISSSFMVYQKDETDKEEKKCVFEEISKIFNTNLAKGNFLF